MSLIPLKVWYEMAINTIVNNLLELA